MMHVQLLKQRFALWNGFYLSVGDAKGLRQESKVRVDEITIDESLVILLLLVLADKAHGLIVEDYDSERYFVVKSSHYFHCAHLESAIPDQCKNGAFNLEPGADCSGNGMPQRRHAGVGVEPVTLPDAIKVLRENDVVIEQIDTLGKMQLQLPVKTLHQIELRAKNAAAFGFCAGFNVRLVSDQVYACFRCQTLMPGGLLQFSQVIAQIRLYGHIRGKDLFQLVRIVIDLDDRLVL